MWVYSGDNLRRRLSIASPLAFWFDYWFFLFAEDTHPIWGVRPIGLQTIARLCLDSDGEENRPLREYQLSPELKWAAKLGGDLPSLVPSPGVQVLNRKGEWQKEWLKWLKDIDQVDRDLLIGELISGVAETLSESDLYKAAYFTRRLAGEVGEAASSRREPFIRAQETFRDLSGCEEAIDRKRIREIVWRVCQDAGHGRYKTTVNVMPAPVNRDVVDELEWRWETVNPVTEEVERAREGEPKRRLVAFSWEGSASSVAGSAREARAVVRDIVDYLRTNWYVRTRIHGPVEVLDSNSDGVTWVSPTQPFWTKKHGFWRSVPEFPTIQRTSYLPEPKRSRIQGARWHLSQAIADWPEDPHSAASKVWQGLEAISPPRESRREPIFTTVWHYVEEQFLRYLNKNLAYWLATLVRAQSGALYRLFNEEGNEGPDWYYWDEQRGVPLEKWYGRVFDPRSSNYYDAYQQPEPWPFFFDESVGIVQIGSRRIRGLGKEAWMERRLRRDLALLYALRNRLVHTGSRIFPNQTAEYLGQVGLEVTIAIAEVLCENSS